MAVKVKKPKAKAAKKTAARKKTTTKKTTAKKSTVVKKTTTAKKSPANSKNQPKHKLTQEEIFVFVQDKAYRLWDEAGKPQGRDWEFWFRAEEEVKQHLRKIGKI